MNEEKEIENKIKELDLKINEHLNPPKGLIFNPQLYNELNRQRKELVNTLKCACRLSGKNHCYMPDCEDQGGAS